MSAFSSSPIRVGVIGVGNWAIRGHLPILQLLPDYEIVAVQSRRREAAERAARLFHIPHSLDTAEEVANHPDGLLPGNAVLSVHIEGGKRNGSGVQIDITGDQGDLYAALARDLRIGGQEAPSFADGVSMHQLIDAVMLSSDAGRQVSVGEAA